MIQGELATFLARLRRHAEGSLTLTAFPGLPRPPPARFSPIERRLLDPVEAAAQRILYAGIQPTRNTEIFAIADQADPRQTSHLLNILFGAPGGRIVDNNHMLHL